MTKELQNKLQLIRQLTPTLQKKYQVKKIGIFGSYARAEQTRNSDIDVLVELNKPIGMFAFLDLEQLLSRHLKRPVDLVTKLALKPATKKGILKDTVYV